MLRLAHHPTRGGWTSLALLQWPRHSEQGPTRQQPVQDTATHRQNPTRGHVGHGQAMVSVHLWELGYPEEQPTACSPA